MKYRIENHSKCGSPLKNRYGFCTLNGNKCLICSETAIVEILIYDGGVIISTDLYSCNKETCNNVIILQNI